MVKFVGPGWRAKIDCVPGRCQPTSQGRNYIQVCGNHIAVKHAEVGKEILGQGVTAFAGHELINENVFQQTTCTYDNNAVRTN